MELKESKIMPYSDNKPRLCYQLMQKSKFLTAMQTKVYIALASFTGPTARHQESIAIDIGISIRTFQKAVNALIRYGIVERRYSFFKRVIYSVVSIEKQKQILKNPLSSILKTAQRITKKIKKNPVISSVLHQSADLITNTSAESTKEIFTKEIIKSDSKFNLKPEYKQPFNDRKNFLLNQLEFIRQNGIPNLSF